jgi:hypothetical protein
MEDKVYQAMAVMDASTGKMQNYQQLMQDTKYKIQWEKSAANKFGGLANGVGNRVKATKTIEFMHKCNVPQSRIKDVTYDSFVCNVRNEKSEKNITRFAVGGDSINYPGEVATITAKMLVAKLLFNSVISTKGARFIIMNISNFYLMTPLSRPEYIRVKLSDIPDKIIDEYNLKDKVTKDRSVYIVENRGMYGLPQSGFLANQLLKTRLNKHGYSQRKFVPGMWSHKWQPV